MVEIEESQYRKERAFIDMDEIPELLKGIDALMQVTENPTKFKNFEIRYTTKGKLRLTAFNNSDGKISYSVEAGEYTKAQTFISDKQMQNLRSVFAEAQEKLTAVSK